MVELPIHLHLQEVEVHHLFQAMKDVMLLNIMMMVNQAVLLEDHYLI